MENKEDIEVLKSENYRTINANGVFGGHRPGYIEAFLYSYDLNILDTLKTFETDPKKSKVRRILECRLVIDPITAKHLLNWLNYHVRLYEEKFGEILLEPKGKETSVKKELE